MTFCDYYYYLKNSASCLCFVADFLRKVTLSLSTTISPVFKGNNIIPWLARDVKRTNVLKIERHSLTVVEELEYIKNKNLVSQTQVHGCLK